MKLLSFRLLGGTFLMGATTVLLITACQSPKDKSSATDWILPIIPHPQEIFPKSESEGFFVNNKTRIYVNEKLSDDAVSEAELLNRTLKRFGLKPLEIISQVDSLSIPNGIVILKKDPHNRQIARYLSSQNILMDETYPGPEGYVIDINSVNVVVLGNDDNGRFYGMQSLLQLIRRDSTMNGVIIPGIRIIDYPDMPLRSAFYGFYLNAMEDDSLISRAYRDFAKIARYKINMIDLASHHYGHLEMEVPGHPQEKLWQRFAKLHAAASHNHLQPRIGGWAKWVNTKSPWGADLTTLECIRTTQTIELRGTVPYTLKVNSGQDAPNVIYDMSSGHSWEKEPVTVTDASGKVLYQEGRDYNVKFGLIHSEDYRKYEKTLQTHLEVLFSRVHEAQRKPEGFPLRWAETFNPPTTISRLIDGRIHDGETVKVTFSYIGPDPYSLIKVRYCRSDERLHIDGPENYIWRWCTDPVRFWGASDFCLDVDETRVLAFDKRCIDSGKTRSQIWADDILYYYQTIRKANPGARIYMWSDMVDPFHNASLYKTEEAAKILHQYGLNDIIMIPWKSDIAEQSVRYFAKHHFPIMPSCQETSKDDLSEAPRWATFLRRYCQKEDLPFGMMHCHWGYAFDKARSWEQLAAVADYAWSVAPYIVHSPIYSAPLGKPVMISAKYEGDRIVFDGQKITRGPLPLKEAILFYRESGNRNFKKLKMSKKNNGYYAIIPGITDISSDIEYYIAMSDQFHTSFCPAPGRKQPYKINFGKNNYGP